MRLGDWWLLVWLPLAVLIAFAFVVVAFPLAELDRLIRNRVPSSANKGKNDESKVL